MGTGHAMRCLSLAQALNEDGIGTTFLFAETVAALVGRLDREQIPHHRTGSKAGSAEDARETIRTAESLGAEWIVVDGYQFDASYQRELKESGKRVLWIDDFGHAGEYCADLVLNQNAYANEAPYNRKSANVRLLLGTKYVLLRREFRQRAQARKEIAPLARRVLVMFGGSDPENYTAAALEELRAFDSENFEIKIIAGGANRNAEALRAAASRMSGVELICNTQHMSELLAWADLAVSAAGSASYELAYMGVSAIVAAIAENQAPLAESLSNRGVALSLGRAKNGRLPGLGERVRALAKDFAARTTQSASGQALVDGQGCGRIAMLISGI
jgi:UDP-2,4-diacetamido-2,4,6-trideoxy-beta-L-altropyranose hydrolase